MNQENSKEARTSFQQMLNDFVNINLEKHNTANHKNLERAIQMFTKTKECWEESIKILQSVTDPNVLTLCSSILKNKFQYDFSQLTSDTFTSVHNSILHIISTQNKPSTALRNNLSICIAFIYIHKFEEIGQLLSYLSACFSNVANKNYIYTVLQVLPQQIDNDKLVVDEDKRKKIKVYLKSIQRIILIELNNIGTSLWNTNEIRHRTLLNCFSNWVDLNEDKQILKSLPQHFVLNKAFQLLQDSDVSTECANVIKSVIKSIDDPKDNIQIYKYLAQRIIKFFDYVNKRIKQQIFMCEDHVNIICTFGKKSRNQFVNNFSSDYKQFVNNIIYLTSQTQLQCTQMLYGFWAKFLTILIPKKQACSFYKSELKQLYTCLSKITRYSLSQCLELNQREMSNIAKVNNDFSYKLDMRDEAEELFKLLAESLGSQECLILSLTNVNSIEQNSKDFWPMIEGYLNPLQNVIDEFTQPSIPLNQLLLKIVEIKSPYIIVQKTFIRILSTCSIVYSKNAEFALKIFNYLVSQLENKQTISTVSRAFENVCTNNTEFVLNNLTSFIQILGKHYNNDKILKGIMKSLSNSDEKLNTYFGIVFNIYLKQLPMKSDIKQAKIVLEKFIIVFSEITKQKPEPYSQIVFQGFSELWKLIKPILQKQCKSQAQQSLLQKCTKVIKYAIRCLKSFIHPLMDDIYSTILQSYSKYPICSYVYLVQVLVTVFNQIETFSQAIKLLFERTCQITFQHLSKQKGLDSNIQLAEDFFGMISRFLRFKPQLINNCKFFPQLLQLIVMDFNLQHHQLIRIFYTFVEDLYMQFWSVQHIKQYNIRQNPIEDVNTLKTPQIIQSQSRVKSQILKISIPFIKKSLKQLEEGPSTSIRNAIIDTLMSQIKAFPQHNNEIWFQILNTIPEDILTIPEKNKFIQVVSNLTKQNMDYMDSTIHLMTKRYVHKITRSSIN